MPSLNTLHLSGNEITGSIPEDLILSDSLTDLVLSYNQLTGTIPVAIQVKEWNNLDLSYNRLTGELNENFHSFTTNGSSLSLQVNRLSGSIPSSLLNANNINILDGNIWTCNFNTLLLPRNDPKAEQYSCGSDIVNVTIGFWGFVLFGLILFFFFFIYYFDHYASDSASSTTFPGRKEEQTAFPALARAGSTGASPVRPTITSAHSVSALQHGQSPSFSAAPSASSLSIAEAPVKSLHFLTELSSFISKLISWRSYFQNYCKLHFEQHETAMMRKQNRTVHSNSVDSRTTSQDTDGVTERERKPSDTSSTPLPGTTTTINSATIPDINADFASASSLSRKSVMLVYLLNQKIRQFFLFSTLIIVLMFLPIYSTLSSYYAVYSHKYAWTIGGAYLEGITSGKTPLSFSSPFLLFLSSFPFFFVSSFCLSSFFFVSSFCLSCFPVRIYSYDFIN
jgi:hypothetical protein